MNDNLKKLGLSIVLFVTIGMFAQADVVRLGLTGALDFMEKPDCHSIVGQYQLQENIWSGFYWEVLFDHFGFGGNYLARFDTQASSTTGYNDWTIGWLGSFDFRYHLLTKCLVDPFAELGFGCAGNIFLPYEAAPLPEGNVPDMNRLKLSLFGDVGLGLALRLNPIHVGGKLNYYFVNYPLPMTQFAPYPLENFTFSLFAGVTF